MSAVTAILFTLFAWWFGTGLVLMLTRTDGPTDLRLLLGSLTVTAVSLYGIVLSNDQATAGHAYLGFTCAVAIWGSLELLNYLGYLSGPRRIACPPSVTGFRRFRLAVATVILHETAIATIAALIWFLSIAKINQTAAMTFTVLWVMRLSAKVNMFLGVRNHFEHWLPENTKYQISYCRHRSINWLLPWSTTAGTLCAAWFARGVIAPDASEFAVVSNALIVTLISLAVLEHWLLVLPLSIERVWSWGLGDRRKPTPNEALSKI